MVLHPTGPAGDPAFVSGRFRAQFDGGASGVDIQVRFSFEVSEEGPHWFDVLLDEEYLLTRIPLAIRFGSSPTENDARAV